MNLQLNEQFIPALADSINSGWPRAYAVAIQDRELNVETMDGIVKHTLPKSRLFIQLPEHRKKV